MTIQIQLPDIYFLNQNSEELEHEVKLSIALRMYQKGQISAGAACEIADLNRYDFLSLCAKEGIFAIQYKNEDITKEISLFEKC